MTGSVTVLIVLMILPLSALLARRLPLASWAKMALAWVAILAGLFLLVSLWQGATATGGALTRSFG